MHAEGQAVALEKPEWIRVNQVTQIFGIGRTKIYELISQGKLKTASIKSRGNTRGTRLISYESVSMLISDSIVRSGEGVVK